MKTQDKVMSAIATLTDKQGYPPSVREIAKAAGVSIATTHGHLDSLVRRGLAARKPNSPRTIHLVREDDRHGYQ